MKDWAENVHAMFRAVLELGPGPTSQLQADVNPSPEPLSLMAIGRAHQHQGARQRGQPPRRLHLILVPVNDPPPDKSGPLSVSGGMIGVSGASLGVGRP